ncbi:hypothetical protein CAC42_2987 [Sphaceloma murrayae]|uniref:Yippee domain-containing protein n=1 Tax=Sphaceloma murrayae TaxID=2082308 RepID=A0A2K1R0B0_9PEZI|nr:hypothetical protein CAC42_2987 [Sphaceloma murrayae]
MPFTIPSPPTLFPTYLTSPLTFRRKSSTSSTTSSQSTASTAADSHLEGLSTSPTSLSSPTKPSPSYLSASTSRLRCARCLSDLALSSQIISKGFTGRHGRAYLVAPASSLTSPLPLTAPTDRLALVGHGGIRGARRGDLPNTHTHRAVPRQLVTGLHTVGDISCAQCGCILGWKYVAAEEEAQRYKVGKFILEGKRVVGWGDWERENVDEGVRGYFGAGGEGKRERVEEEIEFDSQDEDECEDLFMGVWTPQLAKRRRAARRFEEVRTLTGKEIELDIEPDYKVSRIKERVEEKEGIPPVQQRLIYGGKQM